MLPLKPIFLKHHRPNMARAEVAGSTKLLQRGRFRHACAPPNRLPSKTSSRTRQKPETSPTPRRRSLSGNLRDRFRQGIEAERFVEHEIDARRKAAGRRRSLGKPA